MQLFIHMLHNVVKVGGDQLKQKASLVFCDGGVFRIVAEIIM